MITKNHETYKVEVRRSTGKNPFLLRWKIRISFQAYQSEDRQEEIDEWDIEAPMTLFQMVFSAKTVTAIGLITLAMGLPLFWPGTKVSLLEFYNKATLGWLCFLAAFFLVWQKKYGKTGGPSETITLETRRSYCDNDSKKEGLSPKP